MALCHALGLLRTQECAESGLQGYFLEWLPLCMVSTCACTDTGVHGSRSRRGEKGRADKRRARNLICLAFRCMIFRYMHYSPHCYSDGNTQVPISLEPATSTTTTTTTHYYDFHDYVPLQRDAAVACARPEYSHLLAPLLDRRIPHGRRAATPSPARGGLGKRC